MLALGEEDYRTLQKTWKLWEEIIALDRALRVGNEREYSYPLNFKPDFGPMIILDPGSLAFDYPERYGYKLIYKSFNDYIQGMSNPSWHQWISYRTKYLDTSDIAKLTLKSIEKILCLLEKYNFYENPLNAAQRKFLRFKTTIDNFLIKEIDNINKCKTLEERNNRLEALNKLVIEYSSNENFNYKLLKKLPPKTDLVDSFGYKQAFAKVLHNSIGLIRVSGGT
jgi:hypothetical protein